MPYDISASELQVSHAFVLDTSANTLLKESEDGDNILRARAMYAYACVAETFEQFHRKGVSIVHNDFIKCSTFPAYRAEEDTFWRVSSHAKS